MDYQDKNADYYTFPRKDMLKFIPRNAQKVLEIGSGNGIFIKMLKDDLGMSFESWGIEMMPEYAEQAKENIDHVLIGTAEEQIKNLPDSTFDLVIMNDVLEHMFDPKEVLIALHPKITNDAVIVASIPNMRYHENYFKLIFKGDWQYEDSGIMDFTHLKFYTKKSMIALFEDAHYRVESIEGINKSKSIRPILYNVPLLFNSMDIVYKQFAIVAKKAH